VQEADDLLPQDVFKWQLEQLRLFRLSGAHGAIELHIRDGRIDTYSDKHVHKVVGRIRNRTRAKG